MKPDADHLFSYRYHLTRADLAARHALRSELTGWRTLILIAPAILVGFAFGLAENIIVTAMPWLKHRAWIGACAGLAVVYGLIALAQMAISRWKVSRLPLHSGDTTVAGSIRQLVVTEDGQQRVYTWDQLQEPIVTEEHVFLPASADDVVIIPLRAFNDRADKAFFAATISDWICGDDQEATHVSP
jgi:hypothetical protein